MGQGPPRSCLSTITRAPDAIQSSSHASHDKRIVRAGLLGNNLDHSTDIAREGLINSKWQAVTSSNALVLEGRLTVIGNESDLF